MNNTIIHSIFPIPVYFSKLNRKFSEKELNIFEYYKNNAVKNVGNITSNNNYILNLDPLKKLKKDIELFIEDYFKKIITTSNKVKPFITQSWLNYTKNNEFHHSHEHPNSLVSGVLYINADIDNDKIIFHTKKYNQIDLIPKEYNLYNSRSWFFPVETNQIVLFPSSTTHSVEQKKGNNTRLSLAFNVFVKGRIGSNEDLTELNL
jgi:uncharacterized protein (TIGR02466 family)